MIKLEEGFFDQYVEDFFEYFDKYKVSNIMKNREYKRINQQIGRLKEKYPNVTLFLEDKENIWLNNAEQKAILEILKLQGELDIIELKEAFKLGFKEAYIYFKSVDMLKI